MRVIGCLILLVLLSVVNPSQGFASGINAVIASLSDFQTENGGFKISRDADPSLEATAQALFLSSLFGWRHKIDLGKASTFIESLNNQDHGYSNQPGQPSDLESVRHALLSFVHMGSTNLNADRLGPFIESLYDRDTKLYANTFSGTGTIKSTATALQSLSLLNLLQSSGDKLSDIKNTFSHLIKTDTTTGTKYFSSLTADNYYAIVVAYYVKLDLGNIEPWVKYFIDRQVKDTALAGGFFSDNTQSDVTPDDAAYALSSLALLQSIASSEESFPDRVNVTALTGYLSNLPRSLRAAYAGFSAIARTSDLQKSTFKTVPLYDLTPLAPRPAPPAHVIVQGSSVRPSLSVRTFFGLPHAGLDVSLVLIHTRTNEKTTGKLTWNSESQTYTSDLVYKTDELGELIFEFVMKWFVADLGSDLTMIVKDKKVVGYDMLIKSKAKLGRGSDEAVEVGGVVAIGTEFEFDVKLGTVKNPKPSLVSGDFDVVFSVLDSSSVVIHHSVFDARNNRASIHFQYTLSQTSLPGGDLVFKFEVGNAKTGYFSVDSVSYSLPLTMVASNIAFTGFKPNTPPSYKIGDTVEVKMQPGSLPDLRTVEYYSSKDFQGKDVQRKFFMDIYSSDTNVLLFSLPGTPEIIDGKHLSYIFSLPVHPSFNAIGTNTVSFHYETGSGKKIQLKNYDSKSLGFFEDTKLLTYSVKTELHVTNIKGQIKDGKLDYGNDIKFSFQVKDTVTGKLVQGTPPATAYLVLRHKDEKGSYTFTSNKHTALNDKNSPNTFIINWSVNPNAVKGSGILELVVQGADGNEIPLFEENSKNPWKVNVEIGGAIEVANKEFTDILDEDETVFLVEFDLSCNGKQLNDAHLQGQVFFNGKDKGLIASLPVSHVRQAGKYQLSWNLPADVAKAGEYEVKFYREVDITRGGADISAVDPLFSIKLYYAGASTKFPIKLDVVALVTLSSAFFWLAFRKMEIEGTRKSLLKKKK